MLVVCLIPVGGGGVNVMYAVALPGYCTFKTGRERGLLGNVAVCVCVRGSEAR